MLHLVWRATYRDWRKIRVTFDSSFEAIVLFSLLGLVVTALFLTNAVVTPTPMSVAAVVYGLQ